MNLLKWVSEKMRTKGTDQITLAELADEDMALADIYVKELAFWVCVNLIANTLSKCEFKTFANNKEVKAEEYYLWNVEPNRNQSGNGFLHKWIAQLYRHNESLIFEQAGQLLVADSYNRVENALLGDSFDNVKVGNYAMNRRLQQVEVIDSRLFSRDMRLLTAGLYESYQQLIKSGIIGYKNAKGSKAVFNYDTLPVPETKERAAFDDLINHRLKTFFQSSTAVLPLGKGQSLAEHGKNTREKETTRDIRAMIDDVSDMTAKAFLIPPVLVRGDVQDTEKATDQYLSFCIDPLAEMLQKDINRKRYGYEGFQRGMYLKIDTRSVKHIDVLSAAVNIDKLISSGVYSINDIRVRIGELPLEDELFDRHFITKNYADMLGDLQQTEGGDTD